MPTLQEELEQLQESSRELGYLIARDLGLLRLVRRLGMTPKDWIREREDRDRMASNLRSVAEDIAASPHGTLTIDEARERIHGPSTDSTRKDANT